MRQFKAALFDLDGVVFDTEPQYTLFWGSQCRLYHPEHPGLEQEIKGQTLVQIYDRWFSGPLTAEQPVITQRLNDYERQMHYDYIEGFVDYITRLRSEGVLTAVVTSSNQPKMECVYSQRPEFRSMPSLPARTLPSRSPRPTAICVPPVASMRPPLRA